MTAIAQEIESSPPLMWAYTTFSLLLAPQETIIIGDTVQIEAIVENRNKIAANVTFITQIVDSNDIAVSTQEFKTAIYSTDEKLRLTNNWETEKAGTHRVEAYLVAEGDEPNQLSPLSHKWATAVSVRPANLDYVHDLAVEIQVYHPENVTAGKLEGIIELVNYGNKSEIVKIEPESTFDFWHVGIPRPTPGVSADDCIYWQEFELNDVAAFELPAHGRVKLNDGDTISIPHSLSHAGSYGFSWTAKVRLQEPGGVQCLYVPSNKVMFNITAPTYQGINLVVSTDKQAYHRNETMRFTAQIENTHDAPFQIGTDCSSIMIHIQHEDGRNLTWFSSAICDIGPVTIPPHSNYGFDHLSFYAKPWDWEWDQRYTRGDLTLDTGKYLAYATYDTPSMKSNTITIVIE